MNRVVGNEGRGTVGFIFFLITIAAVVGFVIFFGRGVLEAREVDELLHMKGRKAICLSQTGDVQKDRVTQRPFVAISNERMFLDYIKLPPENAFLLVVPLENGLTKWHIIDRAYKDRIFKVYSVELGSCSRLP